MGLLERRELQKRTAPLAIAETASSHAADLLGVRLHCAPDDLVDVADTVSKDGYTEM